MNESGSDEQTDGPVEEAPKKKAPRKKAAKGKPRHKPSCDRAAE